MAEQDVEYTKNKFHRFLFYSLMFLTTFCDQQLPSWLNFVTQTNDSTSDTVCVYVDRASVPYNYYNLTHYYRVRDSIGLSHMPSASSAVAE